MRRALLLLLLTAALMLPAAALADKTITLTFTGDVTLGCEDYLRGDPDAFPAYYEKYGPEYFLGNMAEFFAEDDLTVVNLEGVLTDRESLPRRDKGRGLKWGSSYWFRGPTEYVKVLTSASVEVATLSNNHSSDYGDKGREDTIATLDAAGIQWLNTYNKNRNADKEKLLFYEKDGVRICLFTIYWDDYRQGDPTGNGA